MQAQKWSGSHKDQEALLETRSTSCRNKGGGRKMIEIQDSILRYRKFIFFVFNPNDTGGGEGGKRAGVQAICQCMSEIRHPTRASGDSGLSQTSPQNADAKQT